MSNHGQNQVVVAQIVEHPLCSDPPRRDYSGPAFDVALSDATRARMNRECDDVSATTQMKSSSRNIGPEVVGQFTVQREHRTYSDVGSHEQPRADGR